jgi:hypothetical protein
MMYMLRSFQRILLVLAVAGAANHAAAFALLGPLDATFMTPAIGYNPLGGEIAGPMNLGEGYRWNVQTIYVAFDPSFMRYFGAKGSNAIVQALTVLNNLPAMSKLSPDLREFPDDTRRINFRAATLGIFDLKSTTLALMMAEMGLAAPERFMWTLRDRRPIAGSPDFQYLVIQRNFDPVTMAPSAFVNDTLYYYGIQDPVFPAPNPQFADAIELPVDPVQSFTSLANAGDSIYGIQLIGGTFFTGLTRDDVGGFRYLYRKGLVNAYYENLVTNAAPGGGGAFTPVGGSNNMVNLALRSGVDKFMFKFAKNDSVFGNFITFTNSNQDSYYTNSHLIKQNYRRAMTAPDIIFAAGDLGLTTAGTPVLTQRSVNLINNAALNTFSGTGPTAGPGTLSPTEVITFSKLGPSFINQGPSSLDQANFVQFNAVWGSFDGTTNDPVVYPIGMTIQDLEQIIFAP